MFTCQRYKGSAIDLEVLDNIAIEGHKLAVRLKEELDIKYAVDIASNDLLTARLTELGYRLGKKTKTGKLSIDDEVLEEQDLLDILEWRKAQKLDSSFVGKIKNLIRPDGFLPHEQKAMAAKTGRTTMTNYNHQQSGRRGPVKGLLISRFEGGEISSVDLAQNELRTSCYISEDEVMREWLEKTDAHRFNASMAFNVPFDEVTDEQRTDAKTVVFRLIFGGSAITEGQKVVEAYLRKEFKKFFRWSDSIKREGMSNLEVTDLFGKTCGLKEILDNRGKWAVGRSAINSPIQGLASHCAIYITVRIWELFRECDMQSLVLFGVHDSIVCDCHPNEKELLIKATQQAFKDLFSWGLKDIPMAHKLPLEGELQFGKSLADTKNGEKIKCSTLS